ncbi:MAG TPA: hypothetical protein VLV49_06995 [Terriglobales bacterium]|nr:hypothetical protein [Terriglobales bacterium]
MSKRATASDAQVILNLYDLRRESEMRKARHWWFAKFWPESSDDFMKIIAAMGTEENNWLRQVSGYWSMAAALALRGAVNQELFLEPSVSGEMFFVFAKVQPFLKELREKTQNPLLYGNIETLIKSSKKGREFLKTVERQIAARRKAMAESKAAD